ncbi:hypothetical protein HSBAA_54130 [Vreelandella sulfidaeris]|uniref:Uncharacterized protein n=1 Tax=Vreelandella sulfidaeris TaxID=115553 RepID=A0A455UEM8_9GAMM|nr:hypothetical protein HSBAA_54130 [Halomonas sulfidaeris]
MLAGCQVVPDRLPQAEPAPAAACYFPTSDEQALETSVELLTEWGFSLDTTDTALGLVSASRERELHGYYDPYDNAYGYGSGMRLFGGLGIGSGGVGLGIGGIGFGGGVGQQPVEVERVSLLVKDAHIRISRDIRRFDQWGIYANPTAPVMTTSASAFRLILPKLCRPTGVHYEYSPLVNNRNYRRVGRVCFHSSRRAA